MSFALTSSLLLTFRQGKLAQMTIEVLAQVIYFSSSTAVTIYIFYKKNSFFYSGFQVTDELINNCYKSCNN